jgi:transcriptional regulator with XRE-family HTH domain
MQFQIESKIGSMEYSNLALRISTGNRIRHRRESLGLSQTELAKLADTTQSQISKFEQEVSKIDAMVLKQIAAALGVSTDWLLGLDENPRPVPELVGDEAELLTIYRAMPTEQGMILKILRDIYEHR